MSDSFLEQAHDVERDAGLPVVFVMRVERIRWGAEIGSVERAEMLDPRRRYQEESVVFELRARAGLLSQQQRPDGYPKRLDVAKREVLEARPAEVVIPRPHTNIERWKERVVERRARFEEAHPRR